MHGGTYDKRYFHVEIPGRDGYSAAEALADRGHLVILLDHLGVGDSTRLPDQKKATRQIAALANHAAVTEIYQRIEAGTLHDSIPPTQKFLKVGGGHSMGASQSITQQALFSTYDRLMVLGYTAIAVHVPVNGEHIPAASLFSGLTEDYQFHQHAAMRENFH
jgi:hypothetical protein